MDENRSIGGFSFSPEQIRSVLGTGEGQRLLQLLNRDGGAALRKAAELVKAGDMEGAKRVMEPLMRDPETAGLAEEIRRKQG